MSITRAQIARQLLAQGGSPGNTTRQRVLPRADGKRPGYYGSDAGFGSDDYKDESASFDSGSGSGGSDQDFANARAAMNARTVSPTRDEAIQNPFGITRVNRNFIAPKAAVNRRPPPTEFIDEEEKETLLDKGIGFGKDLAKTYAKNTALTALGISNPFGLTAMALTSMFNRAKEDKAKRDSIDAKTADARLSGSFTTAFNPTRTTRTGPTIDGGDNMPMPMMPFRSPELPSDIESRPSDFDLYAALEGREAMNFGMNPNNMMGAMQRFSDGGEVRQAYGLGSLVKKFKRGVKKVGRGIKKFVKSDAGKAALFAAAYAGGNYFGRNRTGMDLFKNPLTEKGNFIPKFLQGQTEKEKSDALLGKIMKADPTLDKVKAQKLVSEQAVKNILSTGSASAKTEIPNLVKFGIPAAMGASYLFAKNEQPDNLDAEMMKNYKDTSGLKELYAQFPEYRFQVPEQYRLADGGRIGYDMGGDVEMASDESNTRLLEQLYEDFLDMGFSPKEAAEKAQKAFDDMSMKQKEEPNRVMAQEGGIMNLGGLEKDYREGGFVPIGEYEKKDDVPARLSKNEFVFTADAVRAAGGGSVDKGADLMYKTMKNLESRVG